MGVKKHAIPAQSAQKKEFLSLHPCKWDFIIFAFAFLLYANSIPNGYNLDDELVTKNHRLTSRGISALPEIFSSTYYSDQFGYAYDYRPLVLSSFAIEHQLFGDIPYVSHLFNVALYGICCIILFRVLLLLLGAESLLLAFMITLIFAAHPAHTEVVDSIKNRDEILALTLALLSLLIAIKGALFRKKWLYILAPLVFGLSLLSKISAASFAFLVPLAIILFSNAGLLAVLLTGVLFISTAMLFNTGGYDLYQKMLFLIIALCALVITYGTYKWQNLEVRIKSIIRTTFGSLNEPKTPLNSRAQSNESPGKNYLLVLIAGSILFTTTLAALTFFCDWDPHLYNLSGLFGAMILFYALCNIKPLYEIISAKTKNRNFFLSSLILPIHDLLKGSVLPYWRNNPPAAILAIIAGAASIYGLYSGHNSVLIPAGFILLILSLFGKEQFSYWATLALELCLVSGLLVYHFSNESLYGVILFVTLAYQTVSGRGILTIPSAALLLASIYLTFSYSTSSLKDLPACLGFYAMLIPLHLIFPVSWFGYRSRKLLAGTIAILILIFALSFRHFAIVSITSINANPVLYAFLPSIAALVVIFLRFDMKKLLQVCTIAAVAILFLAAKNSPLADAISINNQISRSVAAYGNEVVNPILPKEQDRPLLYLEQPVTARDPLEIRTGTSLEILLQYLHKVILPYPMAFYYGYKFIKPQKITEAIPVTSTVLYVILALTAVICFKRNKIIAFGIIIYMVSVIAAANYFVPIPGQLGERFLLIPSIGWSIVLISALFSIYNITPALPLSKWRELPAVVKYTFLSVLLLYSGITFARNFNWSDDLTLFHHDINYVSQSAQAHNLLALHLIQKSTSITDPGEKQKYLQEALTHFKRSYQIYPGFYNVSFDIGRVYSILNMPDSSVFYFQNAINIDSTNSDAYLNAGSILLSQRKYIEAKPYFECLIRRHPERYNGYENLSFIYYNLGDYQASLKVNKTIAQRLPSLPDPLMNIAQTYLTLNNADSAYFYVQKALLIDPNNPRANRLLGNFKITKH